MTTEHSGRCPHDGAAAPHQNPRYPRALCWDCVGRATDADGRPVELFNADLGGGFVAQHRDDGSPCASVTREGVVRVDGVAYRAGAARFGGVVVQALEG